MKRIKNARWEKEGVEVAFKSQSQQEIFITGLPLPSSTIPSRYEGNAQSVCYIFLLL
jgi:hypothetical protein